MVHQAVEENLINMMQKKPNPELAQASIDAQPRLTMYKPHPKKKGMIQRFYPTFTINAEANRVIDHGKPQGNFRVCEQGEKAEINVFSFEDQKILGYVKC